MDVHNSPAAVFPVVDLRFASLCRDLVAAIFQRGAKGPSELRPRGVRRRREFLLDQQPLQASFQERRL